MPERTVFTASGLDTLEKTLMASPRDVNKAERRALRRTLHWARREMLREGSRAFNVPQSRLSKARRASTQMDGLNGGRAWLGTHVLRSAYAGTPRQQKKGAKVGKHKFPGAFVATMQSGYTAVFKRYGKSRLPIIEQVIEGDISSSFLRWLSQNADERLVKEFVSNLEFYSGARG